MMQLPSIYGITATGLFATVADFFVQLDKALASGRLGMLQVRDKSLSEEKLVQFTADCVARCQQYDCKVILNHPNPRLAKAGKADGIHLSSVQLKETAGDYAGLLVGASCHNETELELALNRHSCDFVVLSPVQKTLTHIDANPLGWKHFAKLAGSCSIPVYALGGLAITDVDHAQTMGACGISSMRDIWGLPFQAQVHA